jgi:hypothetical protein
MHMEQHSRTQEDGLARQLRRLFHPGPLDWILGITPHKVRFHAGERLHGLDQREDGARSQRTLH